MKEFRQFGFMATLRFQINVRVQINVRAGKFATDNKRTVPNKHTGWKIYPRKLTHLLENLVKSLVKTT